MFEDAGIRFFKSLQRVAEENLGADHPCTQAVACAAKSGAQVDIDHARTLLSELSPQTTEILMEAVHKAMREDPNALLDLWSVPERARRPD